MDSGLIPFVLIMQLSGFAFVGQNEFTSLEDCDKAGKAATTNLTAEYKCIPNYKRVSDDPGKPYEDESENNHNFYTDPENPEPDEGK